MTMQAATIGTEHENAIGPLEVKVCSSWEDLELFREQWNTLLVTVPEASTFLTPEWLASWWQAYGSGKQLRTLLFFSPDGELVGLAPLYLDRCSLFGSLKMLHLVGDASGDSDGLDFVVRAGYEERCLSGFLDWSKQEKWDLCTFANVPENSAFCRRLFQYLQSSDWKVVEHRTPRLCIAFPETWEAYLKQLKPDFRPLLTRYPKKLKANHQVRVYQCTREDLEANLTKLFSLHEMRWRERGQTGVFASSDRCEFYRILSSALLKRELLEFWLMDVDGVTVAAQYCFRYGQTVYLLQEGFDPRYTEKKVGYALRAEVFQDLIQRGIQRYDFLAGLDPHKVRFGGEESSYVTFEFAQQRTAGGMYLALKQFDARARLWARETLPEPVVGFLRRVLLIAKGRQ
jgi:CelD/BcsL family acetyltransferase involved in cellulose biosynthesis